MSLSTKALLVSLHISQWTGRKLEQDANAVVSAAMNSEREAGNYTKRLLFHCQELKEIHRLTASMRVWFLEQTQPWLNDGTRMLAAKNYLEFCSEYTKRSQEREQAVQAFIAAYPTERLKDQKRLGDMFNLADYPSVNYLSRAFGAQINVMPLPSVGDFRLEVSEAHKQEFLANLVNVEQQALSDCFVRLHEVVKKAVDRLSLPEAILRDAVLENIRDVCDLLPKIQVVDSPELEAIRKEAQALISIDLTQCRVDTAYRADAADKVKAVMDKMSGYVGSTDGD